MSRPTLPPRLSQKPSGIYYLHWNDGKNQRKQSLQTKDPIEANKKLQRWLITGGTQSESHKIQYLAEVFCEAHLVNTAQADRNIHRLMTVCEFFGGYTPDDLAPALFAEYSRMRNVGPATIRAELGALKAMLNYSVRHRTIPSYPYIDLPAAPPPRDRWLRESEIELLKGTAAGMRPEDRLSRAERFIWIGLEAAARKTSIEHLTWDRVDLGAGLIDFREPGKRQTKKRQTQVPISKRLQPVLEQAYEERRGEFVLDVDGTISKVFRRVVVKAGLPDVSPHVLRHTAATRMAQAGVPLWQVAGVLGSTPSMVEKVYAHHSVDRLRDAVNF